MARFASDRYTLLADQQGRRWERLRDIERRGKRAPGVAFSRLPGAGGDEVGRLVAEKLDYGFFGREIVDRVAAELDVGHWVVRGIDERMRTSIERMLSDFLGRRPLREDAYLRGVTRSIKTLGGRGGVVIVGRGAPYILGADEALRVLLVAPREWRVKRYAEVKALPPDEAESALARAEQNREQFAQQQFGVRQDDPLRYDLVLNTGTLGLEPAADLVVQALRLRFPG